MCLYDKVITGEDSPPRCPPVLRMSLVSRSTPLGYIKHEDIFVETGRGLTHKSNLLVNRVFVIDIFIC